MFAVIKTGGRQYRVVPDDVLEVGKIAGDVGTIVQLGEVLVLGADTPVLGTPAVAGASVAAEVLQHKRGPKVIAFKKRRRKNSRRKRGYRDEITVLRITEILADNAKPTVGPRPKKAKASQPPARRKRPRNLRRGKPQRRDKTARRADCKIRAARTAETRAKIDQKSCAPSRARQKVK
jgi:large subunit ribosomal protein L21